MGSDSFSRLTASLQDFHDQKTMKGKKIKPPVDRVQSGKSRVKFRRSGLAGDPLVKRAAGLPLRVGPAKKPKHFGPPNGTGLAIELGGN
jgi:hypothetical protein